MGCRQAVKARDFDSRIVGSNPATPATFFDPLAQSVEHLTFNQGVPGSNPGRVTIFFCAGVAELADALDLGSNTLGCVSSSLFARTTPFEKSLIFQTYATLPLRQTPPQFRSAKPGNS